MIVNDSYERFTGDKREHFVGKKVSEHLGEDIFENIIKPYFDRCLQGEVINYQEWFEYPSLGKRFVDITYFPYRESGDQISGVIANTRDITERKRAEENLRESELRFQCMLSLVPDMISIHDTDMNIVYSARTKTPIFQAGLAEIPQA